MRIRRFLTVAAVCVAVAACGEGPQDEPLRLVAYDSFVMTEESEASFEAMSGVELEVSTAGDAGQLVSQLILTADEPAADVVWGIQNTLITRSLGANLFTAYQPTTSGDLDVDLVLDPQYRLTPVNRGDVCINFDREWFAENELEPPSSLDDLIDPAYSDLLVVQHPEQSSPGLAFLLATIAAFGEGGWIGYWEQLRANGVLVVSGWTEAYQSEFTRSGGERPIVVSYASSPPVEVLFADSVVDEAPTGVVVSTCFAVVEFAGILAGTEQLEAAQELIDFLTSPEFQAELPLTMFVYPANETVDLPEIFVAHSDVPSAPLTMAADDIEDSREVWTEQWVETVLR